MNNELKQIGRNCLADFLGSDPHEAASMAEILGSLDTFASASEESDGTGGWCNYFSISSYLPYVALTIRVNGWLSKGKAYDLYMDISKSSAVIASDMMFENNDKAREGKTVDPTDLPTEKDVEIANKAIRYCEENLSDDATLSDYEHNLRVAMMAGVCEYRTTGIVASAINYAARQEEKKTETVDFSHSEFVGEIGKRMIIRDLKCIYPGFGGRPVVFIDPNGNKISAWNPGLKVEKGGIYNVKATPVKQDVYKDIKSTMVNRMVEATEKDLTPRAPKKARAKKEVVNQ